MQSPLLLSVNVCFLLLQYMVAFRKRNVCSPSFSTPTAEPETSEPKSYSTHLKLALNTHAIGTPVMMCVCVCTDQRQQAGVEEHVRLGHVHAADELPQVGPVVQRDVGSRQQHVALQHTVQVDGQQLHALWEDQLGDTHRVRSEVRGGHAAAGLSSYLSSRRRTGTVLPVAGQDLSALVDQCVSHCLGRVVEDATESCKTSAKKYNDMRRITCSTKQHFSIF